MAVKEKDIKILWVRAFGLCSMCKSELLHESKNPSQTSLVGENCHIVGDKEGSARWNEPGLSGEERDRYPNLILLCRNHHKIVDDDEKTFTVAKLHQIKADHELWVESMFKKMTGPDAHYAQIAELAVTKLLLKEWDWFSDNALRLLVVNDFIEGANDFTTYIWKAVWPGSRPDLEDKLINLADRVGAYVAHFCSNAILDQRDFKWWREDKSYKDKFPNPRYHEFAEYSEKWIKVTHQLLFNVVVALNQFADIVRATLNPMFLISCGKFTINDSMGVMNDLVSTQMCPSVYYIVDAMPEKKQ